MSVTTRLDERIDEVVFALRVAVEATMSNKDEEITVAEDIAWGHVRKQLFRLVDELLK